MNYYVKRAGTFDVQGPFTLEELNKRVATGELDSRWLATSDIGETLDQMRKAPEDDWCWLAEVQGVGGLALPSVPRPKQQYRIGQVSLLLIIVGFLNLLVFLPTYATARRAPDFQGLPAELVAIACLILSGFLCMAGLMCVGYSVKAKEHWARSTMGMIAGGSALIAWFLTHVFGR